MGLTNQRNCPKQFVSSGTQTENAQNLDLLATAALEQPLAADDSAMAMGDSGLSDSTTSLVQAQNLDLLATTALEQPLVQAQASLQDSAMGDSDSLTMPPPSSHLASTQLKNLAALAQV